MVYGLRILQGQTCSFNEAKSLNLEFTNIFLRNSDMSKTRRLILEGLAIIEAVCPICLLVPALHCLCHYGDGATLWVLLRLLWMMHFERYNKKCKNLTLMYLPESWLSFYIFAAARDLSLAKKRVLPSPQDKVEV